VRRLLPLALLVGVVIPLVLVLVWTSSPTVPLTLSRNQAIERAALDATVKGELLWTRVESKLVTYREWTRVLHLPPSGSRGHKDTMDPDALYWIVAYLGPLAPVESPSYRCDWVIRVFAADGRAPETFGASMCGKGGWQWGFAVLPDHSWWRLGA
jgi:hypothetical protein